MTDAREIIAKTLYLTDPDPDPEWNYGPQADDVVNDLEIAGYRILGPDEPDPVTLEMVAALIEANEEVVSLKTGKRLLHERTDGNLVGLAYAEGARTLGRKA